MRMAGWVVGVVGAAAVMAGGCRSGLGGRLEGTGPEAAVDAVASAPPARDADAARNDAGRDAGNDAGHVAGNDAGTIPPDAGQRPNPCAGETDPTLAPPEPPVVCVPPMVARQMLFPLSGLTVTSARPRLRWNAADAGATVIQICSERTCAQPRVTESTMATGFMPSADIPPGYWFWRIRPQGDATAGLPPGCSASAGDSRDTSRSPTRRQSPSPTSTATAFPTRRAAPTSTATGTPTPAET